jgi:hypothetical protein
MFLAECDVRFVLDAGAAHEAYKCWNLKPYLRWQLGIVLEGLILLHVASSS